MKAIFDASALIAAFVESHPKHDGAFFWLKRARNGEVEYYVAAHSVLEIFSVLTTAPFKPRISPSDARRLLEKNIENEANILTLSIAEHFGIIDDLCGSGLTGGIIYDAIVVKCAQVAGVKNIITLNSRDFNRLLPDDTYQIIVP